MTPHGRIKTVLHNLNEIQKSARECLALNSEPRQSIYSEGINSLITVDECLATQGLESDGLNTFRRQSMSKTSLEAPGGTPDHADASIVSYSAILTEEL